MPNAKRCVPLLRSVPTMLSSLPITTMPMHSMKLPLDSTDARKIQRINREKNSYGTNSNAVAVSGTGPSNSATSADSSTGLPVVVQPALIPPPELK